MIPLCKSCSQPIVRGLYLPWTHVASYRGRGHYASPLAGTYVDPRRPGTRTGDRDRLGAGIGRQSASSDAQPVGASAPESQSLPSGLPTTG